MHHRAVRAIFLAVGAALVLAACGDSDTEATSTTPTETPATTTASGHDHDDGTHSHGETVEVGDDAAAPTLLVEVLPDPKSGWNLRVQTANFRLAPERVSSEPIDGEGHMHLYIDGVKVGRLYTEWHHLGALDPGVHDVRVELSANNHAALAVDGVVIDAEVVVEVPEPDSDGSHAHDLDPVEAGSPTPSVTLEILDDPAGGWTAHAVASDFPLAPERVSTDPVDGEGHMHLYVDGVKITRMYGEWLQMPPLSAGSHEIRVELSANNHAPITVEGEPVEAIVTLEVDPDEATADAAAPGDGSQDDHAHDDHGADHGDNTTRFDAEVADAVQTIEIAVLDGQVVDGAQKVKVEVGSVVAVLVTADATDQVHVHGYDILRTVTADQPTHFAFAAEIPGVFEVELEGSGRLVLELEIS